MTLSMRLSQLGPLVKPICVVRAGKAVREPPIVFFPHNKCLLMLVVQLGTISMSCFSSGYKSLKKFFVKNLFIDCA